MLQVIPALLMWLLFHSGDDSTIYDIEFSNVNDKIVKMSSYKDKKIFVAVFSSTGYSSTRLNAITELYKEFDEDMRVIIVPVNDISPTESDKGSIEMISGFERTYFTIAKTGHAKDTVGNQHPLLNWLTHKDKNLIADESIDSDQHFFVVSKTGELIGNIQGDVSLESQFVRRIITQE